MLTHAVLVEGGRLRSGHAAPGEGALAALARAAMLQYHVRTTRNRRARRRLRELWNALPEEVQAVLRAYETWNVSDPSS